MIKFFTATASGIALWHCRCLENMDNVSDEVVLAQRVTWLRRPTGRALDLNRHATLSRMCLARHRRPLTLFHLLIGGASSPALLAMVTAKAIAIPTRLSGTMASIWSLLIEITSFIRRRNAGQAGTCLHRPQLQASITTPMLDFAKMAKVENTGLIRLAHLLRRPEFSR